MTIAANSILVDNGSSKVYTTSQHDPGRKCETEESMKSIRPTPQPVPATSGLPRHASEEKKGKGGIPK